MQEKVILHAADDPVQSLHGPLYDLRQIGHVLRAVVEIIRPMLQRQDVDLPFVLARKGLDGNEAAVPLDDELTDIDLPPDLAGSAVIEGRFKGERLVDQAAENASVRGMIEFRAVSDLGLHIVRHDRHGDDLAVGVSNAGARRRAEVLKHENVFEPRIGMIELFHPAPIGRKQQGQVALVHLVYPDAVARAVDDDLVPSIPVDRLLQTEGKVRVLPVVAEHGIEVFHDAQLPVAFRRNLGDRRRCFRFVPLAKGTGFYIGSGIVRHGRFFLFRTHAARRCDKYGFGRHDRIDAYLADDFFLVL